MAHGEIAHRAYRIIPLAGGGCRIAAHRSACFDLAPVPPPARLLVRWDDPEACRPIVEALWAGDPEPVRPWLLWNDAEVAAWVEACDARNVSPWTARELRRDLLREMPDPQRPGLMVRLEAVTLARNGQRLDVSWTRAGEVVAREGVDLTTGESRTLTI